MIMNIKNDDYIQWHYIQAKVHCRQNPQWHSGPHHFCIDFLKDDSPFDIFKLLDRLFHSFLPWYLFILWLYVIVLNLGCVRGIKSLNSYAIQFLINMFYVVFCAHWCILMSTFSWVYKPYIFETPSPTKKKECINNFWVPKIRMKIIKIRPKS